MSLSIFTLLTSALFSVFISACVFFLPLDIKIKIITSFCSWIILWIVGYYVVRLFIVRLPPISLIRKASNKVFLIWENGEEPELYSTGGVDYLFSKQHLDLGDFNLLHGGNYHAFPEKWEITDKVCDVAWELSFSVLFAVPTQKVEFFTKYCTASRMITASKEICSSAASSVLDEIKRKYNKKEFIDMFEMYQLFGSEITKQLKEDKHLFYPEEAKRKIIYNFENTYPH